MIRTRKAAQAWVEREGIVISKDVASGSVYAMHPGYPTILEFGETYLEAVNNLAYAIDDARASDARAREEEIPW